ncbi:MAG: hypothetical protein U9N60_00560 [Thermodesulfobacteriota bacterium]|nr:hypothetical protein [Thermodesulfobacteriota bacterium]
MFGSASQGGEQADQLYLGMLGSLIAFLWSAAEYLQVLDYFQYPPEGYKCLKTWGTAGVTYEREVFLPQKTRKLPLRH